VRSDRAPFPHCDSKVLHAPGVCSYCDEYPERQQARYDEGVAFTGQVNAALKPDPAQVDRPLELIERWPGNRPRRDE
jgi:hypothetical protein